MELGEDDVVNKEASWGLQQEYDAITVLAAAHLLHDRVLSTAAESESSGCRMCKSCELQCKQVLQSRIGMGAAEEFDSCGEAAQATSPSCPKVSSPSGKLPALLQQQAERFLDALHKVREMQAQSVAAKDKVLDLGRSFQAECERSRDLEARLEAMTGERDRLSREREQAHRMVVAARSERDELREAVNRESGRAEQLERRLKAQTAEHDELIARDMLQSHALRSLRCTEQQLAQARSERRSLEAGLREERALRDRLERRAEGLAAAAAGRGKVVASLKTERESRRHLRQQLEEFAGERDEELAAVEELFCRRAALAHEGVKPRRAA